MAATPSLVSFYAGLHEARSRNLGIDDLFLGFPTLERATEPALRVLQWNILADGLADDGFLLSDCLHPTAGEVPSDTSAVVSLLVRRFDPVGRCG